MPKRKHAAAGPSKAAEPSSEDELDKKQQADATSSDDEDFPSGDEGEDVQSDDDSDGEAFDQIDVNFESSDPTEDDFHGLKTLLTNYLDGKQYSCSELVEAIIGNPAGSVIKCGEDEDPIGITTALSLQQHKSLNVIDEIQSFIEERCPKDKAGAIAAAFKSNSSALLISERLLNCPPQLAPPLMDGLMEEVKEMEKNDGGSKISRYIFISRAYADPTATLTAAGSSKKASKKAKKGESEGKHVVKVEDLIYATPEGEFLVNKASTAFTFPVPNRAVSKDDLVPHRVVAVIDAKEVPGALKEMKAVLENVG